MRRINLGLLLIAAAFVLAAPATASTASERGRPEEGPEYCAGCKPPLRYRGGPVLDTQGAHGLTVRPIYWAPAGAVNKFPAGYAEIVNRYIADVAVASGTNTNVFSIGTEYYDVFGGQLGYIRYRMTAGSPV